MLGAEQSVLEELFSPGKIREQAQRIYNLACSGRTHFEVDEQRIQSASEYVLEVMKDNYPDLDVPYHSRWRHFEVEGSDMLARLQSELGELDPRARAKIGLGLIVPSVLVDAGAGNVWSYDIPGTDLKIGRSEGLGLASLDMFMSGDLSASAQRLHCDAEGLIELPRGAFCQRFQVTGENPLLAVDGRLGLLNKLGEILLQSDVFPNNQLGDLVDLWFPEGQTQTSALTILKDIILHFGPIWPGRLSLGGVNLGDTWIYSPFGKDPNNYVPFHKLSQWLTYSVIETLQMSGFEVKGTEKLTGLAEYRNGGLFVDSGVLSLRDPSLATRHHAPSSELIIEWRALTVALLDEVGDQIRTQLNQTAEVFPLAKVLEGGTWAAGRRLAAKARADSAPPINIESDGTVF